MISNDWTTSVLKDLAGAESSAPVFDIPHSLTYSAETFFQHQTSTLSVLFTMLDATVFADNAAYVAKKIVRGDQSLPSGFDPRIPLSENIGPHLRRFKNISPHLMEMILIRLADNFATYLLDIIGECINSRPELLKSSKDQMSTEAILSFATLDELHASIIERKIISIAYLSLEKQLGWISDHLGDADMIQMEYFPSVVELIETRNCMVHNRARVGTKYLRALASFNPGASLGQLLRPTLDELFVAAKAAVRLVTALDEMLATKFSLNKRNAQA